jgi:hypothetical protein
MTILLNTSQHIAKLEYEIAKLKFVASKYPDFKLNYDKNKKEYIFSHKLVNSNFSNFHLENDCSGVTLNVFDELVFEYNNKKEKIIIGCIPKFRKVTSYKYIPMNGFSLEKELYINTLKFKSKNKVLNKKCKICAILKLLST